MPPSTVEQSFECLIASAQRVRKFVGDVLGCWLIAELADDILLVADELATNAVVHARSEYVVRVHRRDTCVRVEVDDTSVEPPQIRASSPLATSGRGLVLVGELSRSWGWDLRAGGKSVWVEIDIPAA
jgi:anti-sigma regulatory factor (Ser/Thr protein kinase)